MKIDRRSLIPALAAMSVASVADATTVPPKKCKDGKDGKDGKPGPKGDPGPPGPPGQCECTHPLISSHVDYELTAAGYSIPLPDLSIPTPGPKIANELWYYRSINACVFFDYHAPTPQYIVFRRGGELRQWDRITPLGDRLWNWIAQNPTTGKAHACIVSLDRILSDRTKIIQDWTPISVGITAGVFPTL